MFLEEDGNGQWPVTADRRVVVRKISFQEQLGKIYINKFI
jgi:hypothetical protein